MKPASDINRFYRTNEEYFSRLGEKEFRKWFQKYHTHLRSHDGSLVLDVGCGVGQVVDRLARDGSTAIGVDISPIGIKTYAMRKRIQQASFIVATCYKMPFRDNVFNSVGCLGVLEHLDNPELCMQEMTRVTMHYGKVVIASPNLLCPVYAGSFRVMLENVKVLLKKIFRSGESATFEHREPVLHDSGRVIEKDLDAVTLTDSVTVGRLMTQKGIKITYQSSYLGSRRIIDVLSTLPLLRSIGGGIFLVGRKMAKGL